MSEKWKKIVFARQKKGVISRSKKFHKDAFPLDVKVERKRFSHGKKMVFDDRQEKLF